MSGRLDAAMEYVLRRQDAEFKRTSAVMPRHVAPGAYRPPQVSNVIGPTPCAVLAPLLDRLKLPKRHWVDVQNHAVRGLSLAALRKCLVVYLRDHPPPGYLTPRSWPEIARILGYASHTGALEIYNLAKLRPEEWEPIWSLEK